MVVKAKDNRLFLLFFLSYFETELFHIRKRKQEFIVFYFGDKNVIENHRETWYTYLSY